MKSKTEQPNLWLEIDSQLDSTYFKAKIGSTRLSAAIQDLAQ